MGMVRVRGVEPGIGEKKGVRIKQGLLMVSDPSNILDIRSPGYMGPRHRMQLPCYCPRKDMGPVGND